MALKAAPWGKLEPLALKTRCPRSRGLKWLTATQQSDHGRKLQLGPLVSGSLTTESQLFSVPWTLQHCCPSVHFNEAPWDLLLAKFQPASSHAPTLIAPSGWFQGLWVYWCCFELACCCIQALPAAAAEPHPGTFQPDPSDLCPLWHANSYYSCIQG